MSALRTAARWVIFIVVVNGLAMLLHTTGYDDQMSPFMQLVVGAALGFIAAAVAVILTPEANR